MTTFELHPDEDTELLRRVREAASWVGGVGEAAGCTLELTPKDAARLLAMGLDQDDAYRGGEGWVVVAVGERGRACVLDVDPGFRALRFTIEESGLEDPADELGLSPPGDPGIWQGRFRAVASYCPETRVQDGLDFVQLGEWRECGWTMVGRNECEGDA